MTTTHTRRNGGCDSERRDGERGEERMDCYRLNELFCRGCRMKAVAVGKKGGRRRAGIWRRCEKREDGSSTHGRRGAIKFGRKGTPLKGDRRRRRRAIDSCPSSPEKEAREKDV